jgi:hypothetical protein
LESEVSNLSKQTIGQMENSMMQVHNMCRHVWSDWGQGWENCLIGGAELSARWRIPHRRC